MKTKFFLAMGLLVFSGIVSAQKENRQSKAAAQETAVKKTIASGRYQLEMNRAIPMSGQPVDLTSGNYTLTFAQDSVTAYLPYFGRAYSAPLNSSDGGIKFLQKTNNKKLIFNDKKRMYTIDFSVKTNEDTYRFFISVWLNGTATVNVSSNNRQSIDFNGNLVLSNK